MSTVKAGDTVKKILKQVGNIVAVQALASAATEIGKAAWPKIKEKANLVLAKAEELQKRKETKREMQELLKRSHSHYKKQKQELKKTVGEMPTEPQAEVEAPTTAPTVNPEPPKVEDPPVDAKFDNE